MQQYKQSHSVVVLVCAVNSVAHVLMAIAIPEFVYLLFPGFMIFVTLFVLRLSLLRDDDSGHEQDVRVQGKRKGKKKAR